ncbi:restriction alleviation protein, Lar family [Salmonella phage SSBI34]|nr:restriction alleviation protein, Lar family [Salmonella phage SSBI34]
MAYKPCPFCGSEVYTYEEKLYSDRYVVECGNCGCQKRTEHGFDYLQEQWNMRATDPKPKKGERKVEAKPYFIHMHCECGGEMESRGDALLSSPIKYPHVCNSCGNVETYVGKKYPRLEYLEK